MAFGPWLLGTLNLDSSRVMNLILSCAVFLSGEGGDAAPLHPGK